MRTTHEPVHPAGNPPGGTARGGAFGSIRHLIRARLTTGLLTILPILITFWVLKVIFYWLRDASLWVVELYLVSRWGAPSLQRWGVTREQIDALGLAALPSHVAWGISIFSVLLTFVLLYLVGLVAANVIGRAMLTAIDRVFDRVPFVKSVYRLLKQVVSLFGGEQKQQFRGTALVKFPNADTRIVGFVTNTLTDAKTGEELVALFVPTSPNPTTGYLLIQPRREVIEIDWSAEDAIKAIISGGIVMPTGLSLAGGSESSAFRSVGGARPAEVEQRT